MFRPLLGAGAGLLVAAAAFPAGASLAAPPPGPEGSLAVGLPPAPAMVEPTRADCNGEEVARTAWKMGTRLRATVCARSRAAAIAAIEAAFGCVDEVEARLSTWRPGSELSRLNTAPPGRWVSVSPATAELLAEIREWTAATGGAFDPAVGAAIDAWDLRGSGRRPADGEIDRARRASGLDAWELDAAGRRVRRGPGVRLDAGAFGKGAALREALAVLRGAGVDRALLDFGGQLLAWSRDPADRWRIAVADPERRDVTALTMRVRAGSVATTAASERFVETPEGPAGHVIDPRRALPVPAWGSVTVVADDPVAADVLSTALFVMGREEALAWSRRTAGAGVLILEPAADGPESHRSAGLDALASIEARPTRALRKEHDK